MKAMAVASPPHRKWPTSYRYRALYPRCHRISSQPLTRGRECPMMYAERLLLEMRVGGLLAMFRMRQPVPPWDGPVERLVCPSLFPRDIATKGKKRRA